MGRNRIVPAAETMPRCEARTDGARKGEQYLAASAIVHRTVRWSDACTRKRSETIVGFSRIVPAAGTMPQQEAEAYGDRDGGQSPAAAALTAIPLRWPDVCRRAHGVTAS